MLTTTLGCMQSRMVFRILPGTLFEISVTDEPDSLTTLKDSDRETERKRERQRERETDRQTDRQPRQTGADLPSPLTLSSVLKNSLPCS